MDSEFGPSFDFAFVLEEGVGSGDLESAGAWNHGAIFKCILYSTKAIANGVFQLSQCVLVWTLTMQVKERHGLNNKIELRR